jgi:hypothetical protein
MLNMLSDDTVTDSVEDPGFLPIPDPGSRIPDPKTATKERGKKISCHRYLSVAINFTKL